MSTRIARLWQPGNPQSRVFLPNFWMKFIETPMCGRQRLPVNAAKFEVSREMGQDDIFQYLTKIYGLPVRRVKVYNLMGKMTWDNEFNHRYRRALWKEPDVKVATVYFKTGVNARIRFQFSDAENVQKQMELTQKQTEGALRNERFTNRDRAGVGRLLP